MEICKAADDTIVLKKLEKKALTQGGIALPENIISQPNDDKIGVVEFVGADVDCVEVGDIIAFSHAYANVVNLGDKICIFIKAENVLAILEAE